MSRQSKQTLLKMLIKVGGKCILFVYLLDESFFGDAFIHLSPMKQHGKESANPVHAGIHQPC